jgi:hypothetical protein
MSAARWAMTGLFSLCILSSSSEVLAYRPFQGTDAAVADFGELETEFGPAEPMRAGPQRLLTTAETVFNLGIAEAGKRYYRDRRLPCSPPGRCRRALSAMNFRSRT